MCAKIKGFGDCQRDIKYLTKKSKSGMMLALKESEC